MSVQFSQVLAVDRKRGRATVIGDDPDAPQDVLLVDVPYFMLPQHEEKANYEPMSPAEWDRFPDCTTCPHDERPHPSILVEGDGWHAQCSMTEGEWASLIILKSKDIPAARVKLQAQAKGACPLPSGANLKAYRGARKIFTSYLHSKPLTREEIRGKFSKFRAQAWERLVDRKDRDWRNLHQELTPGDVGIVVGLLGRQYFNSYRGPAAWAKARGFDLEYAVVKASHNNEPMKVRAAGTCSVGMSTITLTAARTWLKDHTRGERSINHVGDIYCSHPFDCFCYIMAHEFCHFLDKLFNSLHDGEEGHGPVWKQLARRMFGIKTPFYKTHQF